MKSARERVEAICHVSARIIMAARARIARVWSMKRFMLVGEWL